jgi:predicted enzyme related to lactoylglutathione lyase
VASAACPSPEGATVLKNSAAFSGFSVDDVTAAKQFYSDVLGLDVTERNGQLELHLAGGQHVFVYPKGSAHQPATFTILNFPVTNIEETVDGLTARGVQFQRYDGMPQDERGIMTGGGPYIAWFTDPAGNILSVLQER